MKVPCWQRNRRAEGLKASVAVYKLGRINETGAIRWPIEPHQAELAYAGFIIKPLSRITEAYV